MTGLLEQLMKGETISLGTGAFGLCLLASIVASLLAEAMYLLFYDNRATGSQIHRAFLLLGPSITFLFVSVQLSLPLSLGLLGALSIVRFRTPIKEPEEIGFLMLLIASSIGIATFNFLFVVILYAAIFLILSARKWTFRKPWRFRRHGIVLANLADDTYAEHGGKLSKSLGEYFRGLRLESISSTEGTTSLQYVFEGVSAEPWDGFQKRLSQEVRCNKLSVFFSRPVAVN